MRESAEVLTVVVSVKSVAIPVESTICLRERGTRGRNARIGERQLRRKIVVVSVCLPELIRSRTESLSGVNVLSLYHGDGKCGMYSQLVRRKKAEAQERDVCRGST